METTLSNFQEGFPLISSNLHTDFGSCHFIHKNIQLNFWCQNHYNYVWGCGLEQALTSWISSAQHNDRRDKTYLIWSLHLIHKILNNTSKENIKFHFSMPQEFQNTWDITKNMTETHIKRYRALYRYWLIFQVCEQSGLPACLNAFWVSELP